MSELIGVIIGLAIIIEYFVNGIKEILPANWVSNRERVIALGVAILACLILPYIQSIPLGKLATLNIVERVILGIFVSRGSNVIYDLIKKLEGGGK
jgi:hypothetical protein